ncbi:polyhomeotic-like protein 3 [Stegastes partitus]|uniref:Polyhomeotic-like protein 3 n=2 Tax=Stegastes partitus TaxID=144197 RepID=A0A9Y4NGF7_9TELE|nr:PREDICTED: polyhomeotic-like protein 3 [Stegastes partitus]
MKRRPCSSLTSPAFIQVSQSHPVGSPGLVRANQSPSPVRQRVSQQTLLLGKGLKGSGQDQVLLRAQMLQSLTLRPPPPGALTIPPSLRLKPPTSTPPPLSRPHAPLFPPLRPRPQPSATATESPATPSRHLSVPPPTLYSPVRAVPLRPRLHSPNGHRAASPRQTSNLQPIAAAPSSQASSIGRPLAGLKSCPLTQTVLGSGQSQHSALSVANPLSAVSHFERSPSAARQLQIIALSSGRQPQAGTFAHAAAAAAVVESPELSSQSKRPLSAEDVLPLPPNPSLPKTSSPPSLLSPASPPSQAGPQTQTLTPKGDAKESEEQRERSRGGRPGVRDDKDPRLEKDDQRVKEEKPAEDEISPKDVETGGEEDQMEVTEEGQSNREEGEEKMEVEKEGETPMDQSETQTDPLLHQHQNTDPNPTPDTVKDSNVESKPILGLISAAVPVQTPAPAPVPVLPVLPVPPVPVQSAPPLPVQSAPPVPVPSAPVPPVQVPVPTAPVPPVQVPVPTAPVPPSPPVPVPEVPVQSQRLPEPHRDLQPVSQEDFCENMSTQSDNQSALSSLSSQSPPSSPFVTPSAENPPPLLPPLPALPTDLSRPQHEVDKADKAAGESQRPAEAETEPLGQSEDESESFGQSLSGPWEPRAWPEGRQVLTHLVEGFVIQEGLQPFPVNRSSLLVPEQVTKPQEVNGTNGRAALPVTETIKQTEHSTDSDEEEGGDTDDAGTRSSHRDRTVLHCQFCGKRGHAHNFMRSKRFCSTSCARGFNVRLTKRLRALSAGSRSERPRPALNRAESVPGKPLLLRLPRDLWSAGRREKEGKEKAAAPEDEDEEEEEEEDVGGGGEEDDDDGGEEDPAVAMAARMERRAARRARRASAPAVTTSTPTSTFKPAPSQWSVEDVTAFIHTLPGCSDVAEAFRLQEIDGQALLLLTEDHLMTSMNIKLGPALKICAHINALKNQ